jgi:hypothetical protein
MASAIGKNGGYQYLFYDTLLPAAIYLWSQFVSAYRFVCFILPSYFSSWNLFIHLLTATLDQRRI